MIKLLPHVILEIHRRSKVYHIEKNVIQLEHIWENHFPKPESRRINSRNFEMFHSELLRISICSQLFTSPNRCSLLLGPCSKCLANLFNLSISLLSSPFLLLFFGTKLDSKGDAIFVTDAASESVEFDCLIYVGMNSLHISLRIIIFCWIFKKK